MLRHNDYWTNTDRQRTAKALRSVRDSIREAEKPALKPTIADMVMTTVSIIIIVLGITFLVTGCACASEGMKASWYSEASLKKEGTWSKSGGIQANGKQFNENAMTCAAGKQYKLGSKLLITNKANGKSVLVVVTDRLDRRFYNSRIDLSKGAFSRIADLKTGLIDIKIDKVNIKLTSK